MLLRQTTVQIILSVVVRRLGSAVTVLMVVCAE